MHDPIKRAFRAAGLAALLTPSVPASDTDTQSLAQFLEGVHVMPDEPKKSAPNPIKKPSNKVKGDTHEGAAELQKKISRHYQKSKLEVK
jgi:hypothetical protein